MTDNKYWLYLEKLRESGKINMFGAVPYLMSKFNITRRDATQILNDWMKNYNEDDYK